MSRYIFTNNATSRIPFDHDEVSTSITVFPGEGERFPTPDAGVGTFCMLTLEDRRSGQIEICRCISRTGDVFTVDRGQEGTLPQYFYGGATVSNRVTARTVEGLYDFSYTKEDSDELFVNVGGDTMRGPLYLPTPDPTGMFEATHKRYVDNAISLRAPAALVTAATLTYIASEGQSAFNCSNADIYGNTYTLNTSGGEEPLDVHLNGVRQVFKTDTVDGDYTVNPGTNTVTLMQGVPVDTVVQIDVWTPRDRLAPGSVNIHMLGSLQGTQDGANAEFGLIRADDQSPVVVVKSEEVLIYVNGVPQVPYVDYMVTYSQIAFAVAPEADARVWGVWLQPSGRPGGEAGNVRPPASPADTYWGVYGWDPVGGVLGWQDRRPLHRVALNATARTDLVADRDITLGSLVTQADTGDTWIFTGTRGAPSLTTAPLPNFLVAAADGRWTLDSSVANTITIRPNHSSTWYVDDLFEFTLLLDGAETKVFVPLVGPVLGDQLDLDAFLAVIDPTAAKVAFSTDLTSFNTTCALDPAHPFQITAIKNLRSSYPLLVAETINAGGQTHYEIEVLSPSPPTGSTYSLTLNTTTVSYTVQAGDIPADIADELTAAIGAAQPGWTIGVVDTIVTVEPGALVPYGRTVTTIAVMTPGPVQTPAWHLHVPAPVRRDIVQRIELNPKIGEVSWVDNRTVMESVATVADLTNTSTLPPSRLIEGKLVYVRATKTTYQRLVDPPGAGTIADWRVVIPAPP